MEETTIFKKALRIYGVEAQKRMLVEEMGELLTAMARIPRGRATKKDVITELADVSIMIQQMALVYGRDEFEKEVKRKIKKLQEKLFEPKF